VETWRLVLSGALAPEMNMAVDEAVMTAIAEGIAPPTVRFYGWRPPSVSLGYFQRASEVDTDALKRRGYGLVRRPTGGRAVLHDRELTYSIIVSESHPLVPAGVTEAYRVFSSGLLHGFRLLGLDARLADAPVPAAAGGGGAGTAASAACFDSPSWYELVVDGKKAAGSAQTRQRGVVLQHGSILLDLDAEALFGVLAFSHERARERMMRAFAGKAAAINELRKERGLGAVSLEEAERAFRQGFERGLGVRLEEGELSEYERELAARLAAEKYGSEEWTFRR